MPTLRTPRSASASPFDLLPRLNTSSPSAFSSGLSSPSHGAGASEPLLPRSYYHPSASSRPGSPSPLPSPRGALPLRNGSLTPTSPRSSSSFPPFVGPPPKAARLGTHKRWAVLLALVLVFALATLGAGGGSDDGYATSVREGWRAGVQGVKSWAGGRWQAVEPGGAGAHDPGEGVVQPGSEIPPPDELRELEAEGREEQETVKEEELEAAREEETLGADETPPAEEVDALDEAAAKALAQEPAQEVAVVEAEPVPSVPTLNVNPFPRPPPRDPKVLSKMRFLSFENHSGFHNQRKSLVNALTLAHLLNRTLLLPPARLGSPVPWESDPKFRVHFSERCKAGLEPDKPIATKANAYAIMQGEECEDPAKWTYTGWDWLVSRDLLAGRPLVDRWNASRAWFTAPAEEGGLGLREDEIHQFEDRDRRSYQILDALETPMDKNLFTSRIELDQLRDEAGLDGKRLLQFGSLFSGARLKFVKKENNDVLVGYTEKLILQSDGLDVISDKIRDQLGSYVAAHARVGDGVFKSNAKQNMQKVFSQLTHDVLGMKAAQVKVLLAEAAGPSSHKSTANGGKGAQKGAAKKVARAFGAPPVSLAERAGALEPWGDEDDEAEEADILFVNERARAPPLPFPSASGALGCRALKGGPSQPLAPSLHCRRPLHDTKAAPHLAPLNVPLYIATDSRSPTTDAALAPFTHWFPCVFFLSDFAEPSEVNDAPVPELVDLVAAKARDDGGKGEWTSDWDGQAMAKYLYPFLEAEIAARAVAVVGTPSSTFSGYVRGILHDAYVRNGLAASWTRAA
ncbi:hypothetical protein JCM10450v2_007984 [Rhodotorula kratochvilovae]